MDDFETYAARMGWWRRRFETAWIDSSDKWKAAGMMIPFPARPTPSPGACTFLDFDVSDLAFDGECISGVWPVAEPEQPAEPCPTLTDWGWLDSMLAELEMEEDARRWNAWILTVRGELT